MSAVGLESIEHTVHVTHTWINELDELLGWSNKSRSYRLLRSVLQALRDWLPVNEAADFAAQLPNLLRGVYYEQWRPATTPVKPRSKSDFLGRIDHAFVGDPILHTEDAVRITFGSCRPRSRPAKSRTSSMPCPRTYVRCGRCLPPPREATARTPVPLNSPQGVDLDHSSSSPDA
jgi:uncharacterized protein (DUF2267 family)